MTSPGSARTYGFGVVGCGVIGPRHAEVADALPNARFVACTDVVPDRAKALAEAHGGDFEPDLEALLSRDDVDVVSVCVPSGLHAEVGVQVAEAGKHLVVEKPIDISLAAADRLVGAVKKAGVKMTVISQHRFDPGLVELRQMLDAGRLGRLVLGDARVKWYRTQAYYDSGDWRGTWALDGGGALMNQGVHYTDLLRWCMGPVDEVMALTATEAHKMETEDLALAVMRFSSGALGTLEASTAVFPGFRERLEISGTEGTVVVEDGRIVVREFASEHGDVGLYGARVGSEAKDAAASGASDPAAISNDAHASQVSDLLAAIDEGREPLMTGEEARNAVELVLAVYESARRRGPVSLPLSRARYAPAGPSKRSRTRP
ncbi:MAG: Gfo/Idh/MocA family oxidoreductase [Actinomycetota bacterium]|nr:Gfo/Idh/MocA family oxidoreductase [Actinomycetota bacterium]